VAVLRFECPIMANGQEVSDNVASLFLNKGYSVVDRSQLITIIDEEMLIKSGLTEMAKSILKLSGINAIIVGTVTRYDCNERISMSEWIPNGHVCNVSLSMKMIDVKTGNILFTVSDSDVMESSDMTANKVLQVILERIKIVIPRL
jgi:curli biogenesis system outer membrane secretion channel CsgG